jgi:hypothetical protein
MTDEKNDIKEKSQLHLKKVEKRKGGKGRLLRVVLLGLAFCTIFIAIGTLNYMTTFFPDFAWILLFIYSTLVSITIFFFFFIHF